MATQYGSFLFRPSKQGFDIVIGNPPYGELRDLSEEQQQANRRSPFYRYAQGGRVNLFQFFYPLALDLCRKSGVVSFIVQNSLMAEDTTKLNRNLLLNQSKIILIDSFPERYDINKRVFKSVTMSVCICMVIKTIQDDYAFKVNIWDDKYKNTGKKLCIKKSNIISLYPETLLIPSCDQKSLELLVKIKEKANYHIVANAGEIDMTKYRPYFTQNIDDIRIITGSNVAAYKLAEDGSFGKDFLLPKEIVDTLSRADIIKYDRIVLQRITGVNAKKRFIGSILSKPLLCANSTNYISTKNNDINLSYLLGLLNSRLLTYFDKLTNTNANITAGVLHALPIRLSNQQLIIDLVNKILEEKHANPQADTSLLEDEIDKLVYKLYELTLEEIAMIEQAN